MKKALTVVLALCLSMTIFAGCNSKEKESIAYEKGVISESSFESKYLGLRFTAPDGYIMASESDMNDVMEAGAAVMDVDEQTLDYAKLTTVYEMMASAPVGLPNVIVMVEKMPLASMTEEQYVEALKEQIAAAQDMVYEFEDDITTEELAGQSYKRLKSTASVAGTTMAQSYFLRKSEDRMICIVTTSDPSSDEDLNTLLGGFKKY